MASKESHLKLSCVLLTMIAIVAGLAFDSRSQTAAQTRKSTGQERSNKNGSDKSRSPAKQGSQDDSNKQQTKERKPLLGSDFGNKYGGLVYHQGKNFEVKCDIYVPDGEGPFPAILCVHGGAWRSGAKWHMIRHAWRLVKADFVVVAINYRHAPKYKFPAQVYDVKAAVRWMRVNHGKYKIDPDNIGAFGYSAGGHLVALLGTTDRDDGLEGNVPIREMKISTRISAVMAGSAPCEFSWVDKNSRVLSYWMGDSRANVPEKYAKATALNYVTDDDPPFLFFHGENDRVVPPSTTQKMHQQLLAKGVSSERKVFSGFEHMTMFSNMDTVDLAIDFFNKNLRKSTNKSSPANSKNKSP